MFSMSVLSQVYTLVVSSQANTKSPIPISNTLNSEPIKKNGQHTELYPYIYFYIFLYFLKDVNAQLLICLIFLVKNPQPKKPGPSPPRAPSWRDTSLRRWHPPPPSASCPRGPARRARRAHCVPRRPHCAAHSFRKGPGERMGAWG